MTVPTLFSQLSFHEIFRRIEDSAVVTVVTPNRRLAQALKENFNRYQSNQQKSVWRSGDILPFTSFLERVYLDAFYSNLSIDLPLLLTEVQACALWQGIIRSSEAGSSLLNTWQTAQLAYEAWQLIHAWRLAPNAQNQFLNEDCSVFRAWMAIFETELENKHQIDPACLADHIGDLYQQELLAKPDVLICYGFEALTPQQTVFLKILQELGCDVCCVNPPYPYQKPSENGNVKRLSCVDNRAEIRNAAEWARSKLEANPASSIAVVVPDIGQCRHTIQRIFHEVMQPDVCELLPQAQSIQRVLPFNISLGLSLAAYPLVDMALSVLALSKHGLTFDRAANLLCSPFLAGGESELHRRALLAQRMRRYSSPFVTLEQLLSLVYLTSEKHKDIFCPVLVDHLSALHSFCQDMIPRESRFATYAQLFSQLLATTGFPGERVLDSTEYQTLIKWHEVMSEFSTMDAVITKTSYGDAVEKLNDIAAKTLFQPQTPQVPIQILGVLEAAGLTFDHLWVMGLSEMQWPLRPRPNPFLPDEIQKSAGMPLGSVGETLNYSRQLQHNWLVCAQEVVLSHPKFENDIDTQEIMSSTMISVIPEQSVELPNYPDYREVICKAARLERIVDDHVPPVTQPEVAGGTAVIKDFAACPFRAWAKHRMQVQHQDEPHSGLNAQERGILVHRVLCLIWRELKTKAALDSIAINDFEAMLRETVSKAISEFRQWRSLTLSSRFVEIERQRLSRLLHGWFVEEKKRGHFDVVATEEKSTIQIGGLSLQMRLDRVDQLVDGQLLIIDYKTRPYSINCMLGERPDEPQLPLYLVKTRSEMSTVAGIAFASIKLGQTSFSAIVNREDILPNVKPFDEERRCAQFSSWDALIVQWESDLTRLAEGFGQGNARVSPKNYPVTCQYCDMKPFCRINERLATLANNENDNDD